MKGWRTRAATRAGRWVLLLLTFPLLTFPLILGEPLPRLPEHPDNLQTPPANTPPAQAMGHAKATITGVSLVLGVPIAPTTWIRCLQGRQVGGWGVFHDVPPPLFDPDTPCLLLNREKQSAFSRRNMVSHFPLKHGALLDYILFFTLFTEK